jgi:hypothetical protein
MSLSYNGLFPEWSAPRPAPHVYQATQLMVDDEKAPVLPPDFIQNIPVASKEEARQQYKEIRFKNKRRHNQYAPGALYKDLFDGSYILLDHDKVGDFDIQIEYTIPYSARSPRPKKRQDGAQELPPTATTWVKVRSARDNQSYLLTLLSVDSQLMLSKGAVRRGLGDVGRMWQVGVKNRGLMTKKRKHYKATESAFISVTKDEVAGSPFLMLMNHYMVEFFKCAFPDEFREIQQGNKGMDVDSRMGGDGSLHTFSISRDLGNAAHVDRRDESISMCTWVEEIPKTAKNWFFILPNTTLRDDASKAIVIKLSHGLSISWNGKVLHHCTSVTDVGPKNHVYGNFTSASKARSLG